MSYKAVIRLLYTFNFFDDLILIYAVDKLLFIDRGLSIQEIAILVAMWSAMSALVQVPTGALADRWSRKYTLVLSGVFTSISYLVWIFSFSFWSFALGFLLRTIGGDLVSGTLQAYTYDFMKRHGKEDDFEKVWGRGIMFRSLGIATAFAAGGYLSEISYNLVLIVSATSPLVNILTALLLPEVKASETKSDRSYFSFIVGGMKQVISNKAILKLMLYSGIVLAVLGILEEYDQVILSDRLGFPNSFIGLWAAFAMAVSSIGAFFAHRLKNLGWRVLIVIAVAAGSSLIVVSVFQSPVILAFLLLICISGPLAGVTVEGMLQRAIKTEERATITSVYGVIIEIGAILLGLFFGFVANSFGVHVGYGILGGLVLLYISGQIIYGLVKRLKD